LSGIEIIIGVCILLCEIALVGLVSEWAKVAQAEARSRERLRTQSLTSGGCSGLMRKSACRT
jgi:hypothetical protein